MITRSQIKYIQSLSEKKFRKEAGCFVAEGPKIVNEFLINKEPPLISLYATAAWQQAVADLHLNYDDAKLTVVSDSELKNISFLSTPNQVLGVFDQLSPQEAPDLTRKISLVLDGIQDPGNFGTIIRIADWYNIRYIFASRDCADAYNPKVVQSTMGSIARVQVIYEDLKSFLENNKQVPVYASTLNGNTFASFGHINEGLLIIGNESKGIAEDLIALALHRITIPRFGRAESLNAAVATGILLSALKG